MSSRRPVGAHNACWSGAGLSLTIGRSGERPVAFAGEVRVILTLLTRREQPVWPGPRRRWAGTLDWFAAMGLGLECGEEGRDGLPA
jgi:hypothetical protein